MSALESYPSAPHALRTEALVNPLGVEEDRPVFSWLLSDRQPHPESVHAVQVRTSVDGNETWDSGQIVCGTAPNDDVLMTYAGPALRSRQRVDWRVRVWTDAETSGDWSEPAWFEMGLLETSDWQGPWIAPHGVPFALLRCPFTPPVPLGEVLSARWYVAGLGGFVPRLNGRPLAPGARLPEYTDYWKRVTYSVFDVREDLLPTNNVLGIELGGGYYERFSYGQPQFRSQLELRCANGSIHFFGTKQEDWQVAPSGLRLCDPYMGEQRDARLDPAGWDLPEYSDNAFEAHGPEPSHPSAHFQVPGRLVGPRNEPDAVRLRIEAVETRELAPHRWLIDFGINFAGWVRLEIEGEAGTEIVIRHAELLDADGNLDARSLRGAVSVDRYVLRGGGPEIWEPSFVRHGFRYVEIKGSPRLPEQWKLSGCLSHSGLPERGRFICSDERLNRLDDNINRTIRANAASVPTDCPQRDERQGWFGDAHLITETTLHHFDARAFYRKWMEDIRDVVDPDTGAVIGAMAPPWYLRGRPSGIIHRGHDQTPAHYRTVIALIPWHILMSEGDATFARRYFDLGRSDLDWLMRQPGAPIPPANPPVNPGTPELADWLFPGAELLDAVDPTGYQLVGAAHIFYQASCLAMIAEHLGEKEAAAKIGRTRDHIGAAIVERFYDRERGSFGTQAGDAVALHMGFAPQAERGRVVEALVRDIEDRDGHLNTGIFGTRHLLEALSANGCFDVAWQVVTAEGYPGWMEMLRNGATTITERWVYHGFWGMNSHSHPAFGSVGAWLYRWLAGIRIDEANPGYRHFFIAPELPPGLDEVEASLDTVRGRIAVRRKTIDGMTEITATVPPGSTATLVWPEAGTSSLRVNGAAAEIFRQPSGRPACRLTAGTHTIGVNG